MGDDAMESFFMQRIGSLESFALAGNFSNLLKARSTLIHFKLELTSRLSERKLGNAIIDHNLYELLASPARSLTMSGTATSDVLYASPLDSSHPSISRLSLSQSDVI